MGFFGLWLVAEFLVHLQRAVLNMAFLILDDMVPLFTRLLPQLKGDTWEGVRFTPQTTNDLTGATIRAQFRGGSKTNKVEIELTIGSGITIEDLTEGIFVFDKIQILDWKVNTYFWDVEITYPNGDVKTPNEGIMPVVQDTSHS